MQVTDEMVDKAVEAANHYIAMATISVHGYFDPVAHQKPAMKAALKAAWAEVDDQATVAVLLARHEKAIHWLSAQVDDGNGAQIEHVNLLLEGKI